MKKEIVVSSESAVNDITKAKKPKNAAKRVPTERQVKAAQRAKYARDVVREDEPCVYDIIFTTHDGEKRYVQWWAKSAKEPATTVGECDKKAMAFCKQLSLSGLKDVRFE